jgi:hypothetical protein
MDILNVNDSKDLKYDIYITIFKYLKYFIYVIHIYIVYIYLRIGYLGKLITSPFIAIIPTLDLF